MAHAYIADPDVRVLVETQRPCATCGMPRANKRQHDLKPTDPAVREAEARRLGEIE